MVSEHLRSIAATGSFSSKGKETESIQELFRKIQEQMRQLKVSFDTLPPYRSGLLSELHGRFSKNSFQNSSRGVDQDQNEQSDKRMKMQLFKGDDPFGWLFWADRYFALNGIREEEKIYVASLYLEGPALKWFIGIDAHTSFPSWKAFRSAVLQQFGRVFLIDNSDRVPGRDCDEEASCKSSDVSGQVCDEESCYKSGEVRESSLVFSRIYTEVAVAGDEDEDTVVDERLKMNKILGQIWKVEGVGWVSCFED